MHILVTGGSGYIGGHTVAALLARGHRLRLFARSLAKVRANLEPLGVSPDAIDVVEGDLDEDGAVTRALDGVDALFHAASPFSFDPRRAAEMARVAAAGSRLLERAVGAGLEPVVHVSSILALPRRGVEVQSLSPDAPPGDADFPYIRSKAAQERTVQALQRDGAPVLATLPGQVLGPDDPYDGEGTRLLRSILGGQLVLCPPGEIPIVDVRDVADAHVRLFTGGDVPSRVVLAQPIPFVELARRTLRAAGRRLPTVPAPAPVVRSLGRLFGWLQPRVATRLPLSEEMTWLATQRWEVDTTAAEALGVRLRPVEETVRDHVAWLASR